MLHRFPNGIQSEGFYQKEAPENHPAWIKTCPIKHQDRIIPYMVINNLKSLLYAINLGSIDLHPFMSRCDRENPDYCVIDLDPHGISLKKTVEVAHCFHEILEAINILHFCKTSGGNGLHIFIPLHAKYSTEQGCQFTEIVSALVQKRFPKITSLERDPKKREKKIYLDCLQNRTGQTIVAPYSVRPRPHARVSTPLLWEEVNEVLNWTCLQSKLYRKERKRGMYSCLFSKKATISNRRSGKFCFYIIEHQIIYIDNNYFS